jgi:DNA-3-methyladenine glycosylase
LDSERSQNAIRIRGESSKFRSRLDARPEHPRRMRTWKVAESADANRNRRPDREPRQRPLEQRQPVLGPLADELRRDMQIRRRAPGDPCQRPQPADQLVEPFPNLGRQVDCGEQSHRRRFDFPMNRSARAIDPMPFEEMEALSEVLPRKFYERPAVEVSRGLLGKILVHRRTAGVIIETEAYLGGGEDLAAHSARGVTPRTKVIFGPPGHAYVYFIYGMYECLNLVAEPEGQAGCVLIRALDPLCGLAAMFRRRPAARKAQDLAGGPGKLTLAMAITRAQNGRDVTTGSLVVRSWKQELHIEIEATPRIGITKCAEWPLRFIIKR